MMLIFEVIFLSVIVGVFVIFLVTVMFVRMLCIVVMILKLLPIFTLNFAHHKVDEDAANDSAHCLISKD